MQHHIGHLAVSIDAHTEFGKQHGVEITPLFARVARIDQHPSGNEPRPKVFNDRLDQLAMLAGAESDFLAGGYLYWDQILLALVRVPGCECLTLCKVGG